MRHRSSWVGLRFWLLLTITFAVLGASVVWIQVFRARESLRTGTKSELLTLVQIIALEIDPAAHEALKDKSGQDSPAYNVQIERLGRVLQLTTDIKFVYTIRRTPDGFVFVLDPTPPGDADGDGQDDKSYLLDPYPEISPAAVQCYETGIPMVEQEPYSDRWGTFLSAYAPIKDSAGRTVAILGIDRLYDRVLGQEAAIAKEGWLIFGLLLVLSGLFAFLIAQRIVPGRSLRHRRLAEAFSAGFVRSVAFEIGLYALVGSIVLSGILGHLASMKDLQLEAELASQQRIMGSMRDQIDALLIADRSTPDQVGRLALEARLGGKSWLADRIERRREELLAGGKEGRAALGAIIEVVQADFEAYEQRRTETIHRLESRSSWLLSVCLVAAAVAVVALALIRKTAAQQQELVEALEANSKQERAHGRLVEGLPIGLFTLTDSRCTFSNPAWDALIGMREGESRDDAFERSLHDEDRDRVLTEMGEAESQHRAFVVQFRLLGADSTRYVECRGVPVLGEGQILQHMLCFALDITRTVLARKQLHEKNKEVLSKNRLLSQTNAELEGTLEAMVHALVKAVEAKDPYTAGHSERVMEYSLMIGRRLDLPAKDLRALEMGTLIHDVGKIGVPDAILTKPSGLTPEEFEAIQSHPDVGYRMVEGIPRFRDCAPIVRWHHERLDGTGYPDGLTGDQIPLLVRIATVADVFDALTSTRAYRTGMTVERALEILREDARKARIDSGIVEIFAEIILSRGILSDDTDEDFEFSQAA